jgi:hypothetical protein
LPDAAPELPLVAAGLEGSGAAPVLTAGEGRVGSWAVESPPGSTVPAAHANRVSAVDAPTTSETSGTSETMETRRATADE